MSLFAYPAFSMGSEDLNSSSLAHLPSTLAAKQSSTPCLMLPSWKQIEKYCWILQLYLLKIRSQKRLSQIPQYFNFSVVIKYNSSRASSPGFKTPNLSYIASGHLSFLYLTFLVGDFSHTTCLFKKDAVDIQWFMFWKVLKIYYPKEGKNENTMPKCEHWLKFYNQTVVWFI